jgi:hypothetical protein
MSDRATIADAFQRHEDEAGGYASPSYNPERIVAIVARDLGISEEEVRSAMIDTWAQVGGG